MITLKTQVKPAQISFMILNTLAACPVELSQVVAVPQCSLCESL